MKRALLLCLAIPLLTQGIAQEEPTNKFGIKLGVDLSTWYDSGISGTQWKIGFLGGLVWDIDFHNKFHFSPEILYIQKGATQLNQTTSGERRDQWTMNYIEVPLLGKFELNDVKGNHPFFSLGPSLGFFVGGNVRQTQDGTEISSGDIENLDRKYDIGAIAGAGMDLGRWVFEFRGQVGFVSMINASTARNATLSINFSYFFNGAQEEDEVEEINYEEY